MQEGAPKPKSQESGNELVEKVKGLESKIKGLKWHKRIAYALAMVGALAFASEKIDSSGDQHAIDTAKKELARIDDLLSAIDKGESDSNLDGSPTAAGLYRTIMNPDEIVEQLREESFILGKLLSETDRSAYEKLTEAPDY